MSLNIIGFNPEHADLLQGRIPPPEWESLSLEDRVLMEMLVHHKGSLVNHHEGVGSGLATGWIFIRKIEGEWKELFSVTADRVASLRAKGILIVDYDNNGRMLCISDPGRKTWKRAVSLGLVMDKI